MSTAFKRVNVDKVAHNVFWQACDSDSPEAAPFWPKWRQVIEGSVSDGRRNVAEWRRLLGGTEPRTRDCTV
jgi:hypothetical protein